MNAADCRPPAFACSPSGLQTRLPVGGAIPRIACSRQTPTAPGSSHTTLVTRSSQDLRARARVLHRLFHPRCLKLVDTFRVASEGFRRQSGRAPGTILASGTALTSRSERPMARIVCTIVVASLFAACGGSPSKTTNPNDDNGTSGVPQKDRAGSGPAACPTESERGSLQTDLYSADGSVEGLPEVTCTFVRNRDGEPIGFRAVFGEYDSEDDDGPSHANRPEVELHAEFYGYDGTVSDDNALLTLWHLDEEGHHEREEGVLEFDPSTGEGTFRGRHELEFTCAPRPRLSNAEFDTPETPAPGTAIVTLGFREHVYVVSGIRCERVEDRSLRLVTDGSTCPPAFLELSPKSDQPLVGTGTYPDYFRSLSSVWAAFETRQGETSDWGPGTLELQGEDPYRGFATFPTRDFSSPDRVEFHCPR